MKSIFYTDGYGKVMSAYSYRDFRDYHRLMGKSDEEIDQMIKEIESAAEHGTGSDG